MNYANSNSRHFPLHEQMAVCDANYIRLLKLLPVLSEHRDSGFNGQEQSETEKKRNIVIPGAENGYDMQVSFTIMEQFRYTTEVSVVQLLPHAQGHYSSPCMQIRMYHDARTAEVISYQHHRQYYKAPLHGNTDWQGVTLERTQLNIFLGEWLVMCLNRGLASHEGVNRLMLSQCSGNS